jgi:UDP-N-acetyl-alpha-D-quinovosamine dehydrogenase
MFDAFSPKPARVLVTGSNGFIGRNLCRILDQNGWSVVGVRRFTQHPSETSKSGEVCLPLLSDADGWQRSLTSIDCVVHLAARVHQLGASTKAATDFYEINVQGTRFVAEQAARAGVRRFVFLSSIKVNGEGAIARSYRADDIPNPCDAYGRSKLDAECVLRDICVKAGMDLIVIRSPLVYGPGVRANFERLLRLARLGLPLPLGSIENRRSLIGVWNLVDFIEVCMTHPAAGGETWLIADGEDLSTPDLVSRLARLMGKRARLFSFPPLWLKRLSTMIGLGAEADRLCDSLQVDTAPARTVLNWRPPVSVDEGLARTVEAYRAGHGA